MLDALEGREERGKERRRLQKRRTAHLVRAPNMQFREGDKRVTRSDNKQATTELCRLVSY